MSFNPHQWYLMGGSKGIYDDAVDVYSLRRVYNTWDKALIQVRRSSDDALVWVFPDSNGVISLSSLVNTYNNISIPEALTLGSWIGSNDGYVTRMLSQNYANNYVFNNRLLQGTSTSQPKIISAGAVITKNGKPAIDFLSDTRYFTRVTPISSLDSGNSFTIISVSSNEVSDIVGCLINTNGVVTPNDYRFEQKNDNRLTNNQLGYIKATGIDYYNRYLTSANTTNQKLITTVVTSSSFKSYYNNTLQDTEAWSGSYTNNNFAVGVAVSLNIPLNGTIQEIIIYPSDKTADISKIHTALNNYYTIY